MSFTNGTFELLIESNTIITLFKLLDCFRVKLKPFLARSIDGSNKSFQSSNPNFSCNLTIPSTDPGTPDAK